MLHTAQREDVLTAETPEGTKTHYPIPHRYAMDLIEASLKETDAVIKNIDYTLSREKRVAGEDITYSHNRCMVKYQLQNPFTEQIVVDKSKTDEDGVQEWELADEFCTQVGFLNTHDKSYAFRFMIGEFVLVCANGTWGWMYGTKKKRKHTRFVEKDIHQIITDGCKSLPDVMKKQAYRIQQMKDRHVSHKEAKVVLMDAGLQKIVSSSKLLPIFGEWKHPHLEYFEPHTQDAWGLFNAFSHVMKYQEQMKDNFAHPRNTFKLHGLFQTKFGIA